MNDIIQQIYKTGSVVGTTGTVHKLHSSIDREEGIFLTSVIEANPTISNTLEVGFAYGLSSLYICLATRNRPGVRHTIIDPFQHTNWDGVGIRNLKAAGIDFFSLIEDRSEFALPKLLEEHEGQYDFIFIDGNHTFDHTLVDSFFATRLLRVGRILVLDDVHFPSVRRVVDFLRNYPCYQEEASVSDSRPTSWKQVAARLLLFPISRNTLANILSRRLYCKIFDNYTTRMVALRKTKEDDRKWNWHNDLF